MTKLSVGPQGILKCYSRRKKVKAAGAVQGSQERLVTVNVLPSVATIYV